MSTDNTDKVDAREASAAYDKIDRYLRNNIDDDDYAEYSAALDLVSTQPEGYVLVPVELIECFRHQRQCDEEGEEIAVSRQAVCELVALITAAQEGK